MDTSFELEGGQMKTNQSNETMIEGDFHKDSHTFN